MSNSDIWHKYHAWYFEIVIWNNFEISRVVFKQKSRTNDAIHVYTTTRKSSVIFTCRSFKYLSWNTTALSQLIAEISHIVVNKYR